MIVLVTTSFSNSTLPSASPVSTLLFPFPFPSASVWQRASQFHWTNLLSIRWWLLYILQAYEEEPGHVLMEVTCIVIILWLLIKPSFDPAKESEELSEREEQKLINEWEPASLAPQLPSYLDTTPRLITTQATNAHVSINNTDYVNYAAANYLGLADHDLIKEECRLTIDKYGVGSCGPRGFYGSFDVHLELESKLAAFFRAESCILYSDGLACLSSIIPAFAKRGDLIVCDEGCNYAIQQGIGLSRSNVLFYKHNDAADLERVLQQVAEDDFKQKHNRLTLVRHKLNRRFIVTEGIFAYSGQIAQLDAIVRLKHLYKYRLIVDDSHAVGVLGGTGRGSIEHYNLAVSYDVDFLCATMDTSLATIGGFCVGSHVIVNHQRLSGAGYCFSASQPPYSSVAGIVALKLIDQETWRVKQVQHKCQQFYRMLNGLPVSFTVSSSVGSPIVSIKLVDVTVDRVEQLQVLHRIKQVLMDEYHIIPIVSDYILAERVQPQPSLKLLLCAYHEETDLKQTAEALKNVLLRMEREMEFDERDSFEIAAKSISRSHIRNLNGIKSRHSNGPSVRRGLATTRQ